MASLFTWHVWIVVIDCGAGGGTVAHEWELFAGPGGIASKVEIAARALLPPDGPYPCSRIWRTFLDDRPAPPSTYSGWAGQRCDEC